MIENVFSMKDGDDMNYEDVMVFSLPHGHGLLECATHDNEYRLISCYLTTYHEPESQVPAEDERDAVQVFGISFPNSASVDAFIHALTHLSEKMKGDNK